MLCSQSDISFWPSIPEPYFPEELSENNESEHEHNFLNVFPIKNFKCFNTYFINQHSHWGAYAQTKLLI